jgi:hypothetical protein
MSCGQTMAAPLQARKVTWKMTRQSRRMFRLLKQLEASHPSLEVLLCMLHVIHLDVARHFSEIISVRCFAAQEVRHLFVTHPVIRSANFGGDRSDSKGANLVYVDQHPPLLRVLERSGRVGVSLQVHRFVVH